MQRRRSPENPKHSWKPSMSSQWHLLSMWILCNYILSDYDAIMAYSFLKRIRAGNASRSASMALKVPAEARSTCLPYKLAAKSLHLRGGVMCPWAWGLSQALVWRQCMAEGMNKRKQEMVEEGGRTIYSWWTWVPDLDIYLCSWLSLDMI